MDRPRSGPRCGYNLYLGNWGNYYAWRLFCRSALIVLPWDGFGLLIALAEVSSLLRRPREKVG